MSEPTKWDEWDTYMWVVAHPDDAEFSSAGTIARLAKLGKKVIIVQVTSGDKGTPDSSVPGHELAYWTRSRRGECRQRARRRDRSCFCVAPTVSWFPIWPCARRSCDRFARSNPMSSSATIRIGHTRSIPIIEPAALPRSMRSTRPRAIRITSRSIWPTASIRTRPPKSGSSTPNSPIWSSISLRRSIPKSNRLREHASQIGDGIEMAKRVRERNAEVAAGQEFELAEAYKTVQMRR